MVITHEELERKTIHTDVYIDIKEQRGQYWLENIMKDRFAVSMFGQKRLSREGGIEIVVKELCTRMARDGCQVTCYNKSGHHVSGAEYDGVDKPNITE